LATGATRAYVEDLREEYARDFIFPMMRANAIYESRYLLGTAIARPLITKRLIEIAHEEGAQAVAHGATGKGNDQVRFELSAMALDPSIKVIAPWREWNFRSRTDLTNFAEQHDIPLPVAASRKLYSMDRNMLHCSFEGGELENPWLEPGPGSYLMAVPVEQVLDEAEYIELEFISGDPVALNGEKLSPAEMVKALNTVGGKHGVGRLDMVENRFVGMKSRGVYETPGGTILHVAHRDLEGICLDRDTMHLRDSLIPKYADCIYNGFWFAPEREAMQKLIDETQKNVSGTVRIKLYKGNVIPVGRKSPYSLYREDLATFEEDDVYDQADAAGFIKLQGLRLLGYKK
jgi:argininosuccinate synthase